MGGIQRLLGEALRIVAPAAQPGGTLEKPAPSPDEPSAGSLEGDALAIATGQATSQALDHAFSLEVAAPAFDLALEGSLWGETDPQPEVGAQEDREPRMTAATAEGSFRRVEGETTSSTRKRLFGNEAVLVKQKVAANAEAEKAALAALSPEQRQAYERLSAQSEGDLITREGLQNLLLSGKLTQGANKDGDSLLAALDKLSQAPAQEGIDHKALLAQTVREVANPASIEQKGQMTCAATTVQTMLAKEDPAEYVRLVTGLASPKGEVTMKNGDVLKRPAGTAEDDGSGRSISGRMMQAAFTQYGTGKAYDNAKDTNADGSVGLTQSQVGKVVRATVDSGAQTRVATESNRQQVMEQIADSLAKGKSVAVGVEWGDRDANGKIHAGHEILVDRIEGGRVYYTNPQGYKESMSQEEFSKRLIGATLRS